MTTFFVNSDVIRYEGHPICSDNGLISQKLLLKSEVYYPLHVAMGVDNSFVKYEVLSQPDLMLNKVNNTVEVHGHEKSRFELIYAGG